VLEREGLAEVVLAQGPALQEEGADPAARKTLHLQRAGELRLRDQSGLGQEVSDPSSHGLNGRSLSVEDLAGLSLSGADEEEVERFDGLLQGRGAYARSRPVSAVLGVLHCKT
jgi:hypothetical protein